MRPKMPSGRPDETRPARIAEYAPIKTKTSFAFALLLFSSTFLIYRIEVLPFFHLNVYRFLLFSLFLTHGLRFTYHHTMRDPRIWALGLLFLLKLVSLTYSIDQKYGLTQLEQFVEGVMIFLIIRALLWRSPNNLSIMLRALFAGFLLVNLLGFYQQSFLVLFGVKKFIPFTQNVKIQFGSLEGWYPFSVDNRLLATFEEPNVLGHYLAVSMCLMAAALIYRRGAVLFNWLSGLLLLCGAVDIVATASRSSLISLCFGMLLALLVLLWNLTSARRPMPRLRNLIPLGLLLTAFLFLGWYFGFGGLLDAFSKISEVLVARSEQAFLDPTFQGFDLASGSRFARSTGMLESLTPKDLLIGVGEGGGETAMHNVILLTLHENGFLGLLLLLSFLLFIIRDTVRLHRLTALPDNEHWYFLGLGVLSATLATLLTLVSYGTPFYSNMPWILFGLSTGSLECFLKTQGGAA